MLGATITRKWRAYITRKKGRFKALDGIVT